MMAVLMLFQLATVPGLQGEVSDTFLLTNLGPVQ